MQGIVTDEKGSKVKAAIVVLLKVKDPDDESDTEIATYAETDEEGRFMIQDLNQDDKYFIEIHVDHSDSGNKKNQPEVSEVPELVEAAVPEPVEEHEIQEPVAQVEEPEPERVEEAEEPEPEPEQVEEAEEQEPEPEQVEEVEEPEPVEETAAENPAVEMNPVDEAGEYHEEEFEEEEFEEEEFEEEEFEDELNTEYDEVVLEMDHLDPDEEMTDEIDAELDIAVKGKYIIDSLKNDTRSDEATGSTICVNNLYCISDTDLKNKLYLIKNHLW